MVQRRSRQRPSTPAQDAKRAAHAAALERVAQVLGGAFSWFLAPVRLVARAQDLRLIERINKIDLGLVTVAMILASLMRSSDAEGRIVDAFAIYRQIGGAQATKEGFRQAVHRIAALLLDLIRSRLARHATAAHSPLAGRLARFADVLMPDGSAFKLAAALAEGLPGAGSAAALKLHAVYSVRAEGVADIAFTNGREHDSPHFKPIWLRGALYLWDLGYNDYCRVIDAVKAGAHVLQRLKDGADPRVLAWYGPNGARHEVEPLPGRRVIRLNNACEFRDELLAQSVLDLDVELRDEAKRRAVLRVVRVPFEGHHHYYLTSLPRGHFTPHDVAELYAVRWEVELYFKDLQGGTRIDEVSRLSDVNSLRAVVYASLLAQMLSREVTRAANTEPYASPTGEAPAVVPPPSAPPEAEERGSEAPPGPDIEARTPEASSIAAPTYPTSDGVGFSP